MIVVVGPWIAVHSAILCDEGWIVQLTQLIFSSTGIDWFCICSIIWSDENYQQYVKETNHETNVSSPLDYSNGVLLLQLVNPNGMSLPLTSQHRFILWETGVHGHEREINWHVLYPQGQVPTCYFICGQKAFWLWLSS